MLTSRRPQRGLINKFRWPVSAAFPRRGVLRAKSSLIGLGASLSAAATVKPSIAAFSPDAANALHHGDFAPPSEGDRRETSAERKFVVRVFGSAFGAAKRTNTERISGRFNSRRPENTSRSEHVAGGIVRARKMGSRFTAAPFPRPQETRSRSSTKAPVAVLPARERQT